MQLEEARSVDLGVGGRDVATAQAEADEAEQLLAELERAAVEDADPPRPAEVAEQRELSRFARLRVDHTARRADRARAAARVLALDEIGREIDVLAGAASKPSADIAQAARKLAAAAITVKELCRLHDEQVQALADRAAALGVEEAAPVGPRATSAHVALVPGAFGQLGGIAHGRTRVLMIGEQAGAAVLKAAAGDADAAVKLVGAVHEQPVPVRADRYYRAPAGIVAECGPESPEFARQVRAGEMARLTGREVALYLEGKLDGRDH